MAITLREINKDNFRQCIKLETFDEQKTFVATNVFSIAQSKVEPNMVPMAVYDGEEMVGFIMFGPDTEEDCYVVARLMIDKHHQGKGYGRAAMVEAIKHMRAAPDCREIALSFEPENVAADRLYESLGFRKTGEVIEGELVARLRWENEGGKVGREKG
ncbi:MAG: GNAT family N-acetyltransferase [Pyrinomonadaceae bacterium]